MFAGDKVRPAVDVFRPQLQAFEQFEQHFAAPGRLGGEQHAAFKLLEETGQGRQWLVGLGFDGQVGPTSDSERQPWRKYSVGGGKWLLRSSTSRELEVTVTLSITP